MALKKIATTCEGGPCPTVWETGTPDAIVQGFKVDDPEALATMQLPDNETAVRVPIELLRQVARDYFSS